MKKYGIEVKTKYYVDYICDNPTVSPCYYQLVRTKDDLILYANENLKYIKIYCWENHIQPEDITIL